MKKSYEKPIVYSEKLVIDTLRAGCCTEASPLETMDLVELLGCSGNPCECWQTNGAS